MVGFIFIFSGCWEVLSTNFRFFFYFSFFFLLFSFVVIFLSFLVYLYSYFYLFFEVRFYYFLRMLLSFSMIMCFLLFSSYSWSLLVFWDLLGISRFFLVFYYISQSRFYGRVVTLLRGRFGDFFLFLVLFSTLLLNSFIFVACFLYFFVIVVGATKSAQFPFIGWLPEAMAAPTPVSSLVHRSTLVTAGLVLFWLFSWVLPFGFFSSFLISFSLLSLCFSGLLAFFESDSKKLVALRTLSQISFCLLSLALGFSGLALLHVLSHAFIKCGLFLQVGYLIYIQLGQQDSRILSFSVSPLISLILLLSCFSLCGLMFTSGGVTKELILGGLFSYSLSFISLFLFIFGLRLTFFYSLRLLFFTFLFFFSYCYVGLRVFSRISVFCVLSGLFLTYFFFLNDFLTFSLFFNVGSLVLFYYLLVVFVLFWFAYIFCSSWFSLLISGDFLLLSLSRFIFFETFECLINRFFFDFFMLFTFVRVAIGGVLFSSRTLLLLSLFGVLFMTL